VAPLDPRALRLRAERLARAIDLANRTEAARRNLEQYQSHRSKLTAQRDEFLDKGEPGARLHAAEAAATGARAALEQTIGKLTEARQKRQESEELERIFDERTFNRICPTCTRPITDVEAARLLHSLRESTERVRAEEAAQVAALAAAQAQVATADAERAAANELMQKLASLNERLSDGERMIAELEAEHTRELAELDSILAAAGLHAPPQPTEVEAAQAAAERGAQLATLVGTLEQLGHRAAVARDGMLEADSEIMALGPVSYDEEAHQKAVSTLDAARHAAAAINRIDIELRAQPAYEATRREAERELADLERQTQDVEQARQALGFDIVALREARGAEAAVAEAQKAAREELAQAREALRDAQTALRRVIEDRDRLLGLVEAAERRGREADELERMYREFAEFDKFVADHVGPLLAETTERLLSLVTHGKYDRVRFDENYGIEVFDGDECFKLEGFSGGERDVVALCSRLAMSELVGSSALRPPRFLVLDEVFGSLDSERRSQLLETLGSLAYGGHFQQMFIISHVDDVQQSPVMNEAWTIEERAGVSHVVRPESLTPALA
jgi:exonuclease SbcC